MKTWILSISITFFFSSTAYSNPRKCTVEEANQLEKKPIEKNWRSFYEKYEKFRHCDNGAPGDRFNEIASYLVANDWAEIEEFVKIIKRDPAFEKFVYVHLNETTLQEDVYKILKNVDQNCPSKMKEICKNIRSCYSFLK